MTDFRNVLIVTDLDGTFFGKKSALVPRNMEAVERFKAAGGMFTVASGRFYANMLKPIPHLAELVNAPMICCNGALLYDIRTRTAAAEKPMDRREGWELLHFLFDRYRDVFLRISTPQGFLIDPKMLQLSEMLQHDVSTCPPEMYLIRDPSEWDNYVWYKFVVRGDAALLDTMRADVEAHGFPAFEFSKSGATFFEAQAKGINKAAMLPELRAYAEIIAGCPVTIYACGDYENDLAMMKAADCAVCPSNALPEVKEISDYCLCHHTEGLIADLVEILERKQNNEA